LGLSFDLANSGPALRLAERDEDAAADLKAVAGRGQPRAVGLAVLGIVDLAAVRDRTLGIEAAEDEQALQGPAAQRGIAVVDVLEIGIGAKAVPCAFV